MSLGLISGCSKFTPCPAGSENWEWVRRRKQSNGTRQCSYRGETRQAGLQRRVGWSGPEGRRREPARAPRGSAMAEGCHSVLCPSPPAAEFRNSDGCRHVCTRRNMDVCRPSAVPGLPPCRGDAATMNRIGRATQDWKLDGDMRYQQPARINVRGAKGLVKHFRLTLR